MKIAKNEIRQLSIAHIITFSDSLYKYINIAKSEYKGYRKPFHKICEIRYKSQNL